MRRSTRTEIISNNQQNYTFNLSSFWGQASRNRFEVHAKGYLKALQDKALDIELSANPFPPLVAVKALRAMYRYHLDIKRPLANHISCVIQDLEFEQFEREQRRHYGRVVVSGEMLKALASSLSDYLRNSKDDVYSVYGQRYLPGFEKTLTRQCVLMRNNDN